MKLANVKVGGQYFTKVGPERIAVIVVRKREMVGPSGRKKVAFVVKRTDNGNLLPKPRAAAALHPTSKWYTDPTPTPRAKPKPKPKRDTVAEIKAADPPPPGYVLIAGPEGLSTARLEWGKGKAWVVTKPGDASRLRYNVTHRASGLAARRYQTKADAVMIARYLNSHPQANSIAHQMAVGNTSESARLLELIKAAEVGETPKKLAKRSKRLGASASKQFKKAAKVKKVTKSQIQDAHSKLRKLATRRERAWELVSTGRYRGAPSEAYKRGEALDSKVAAQERKVKTLEAEYAKQQGKEYWEKKPAPKTRSKRLGASATAQFKRKKAAKRKCKPNQEGCVHVRGYWRTERSKKKR